MQHVVVVFFFMVAVLSGCGTTQSPPVAGSPAPSTPRVDSISVVPDESPVDHARGVMERAKDNVPPERRDSPLYQEAATIETRALQLLEAGLFPAATALFDEARSTYQIAALAPITEEGTPKLQAAIGSFVQTLETSIETRDVQGMQAMMYRDRDWRAFFETAEDITVVVRPGLVQEAEHRASLVVEMDLTFRPAQGQQQRETLKHLWMLQHLQGDWMIRRVVLKQ